jgi:hypothetical protein
MAMALSLLLCLVTLVASWGCTSPTRSTRIVHEDGRTLVRLVVRNAGPATPFTHPVSLTEADWATILHGIKVQLKKRLLPSIGTDQAGPKEAFFEDERSYLARHLTEAFSVANPDEGVVFFLSQQRDQRGDVHGGPGVTEITSGGLFVKDERLHFVLANYRHAATVPLLVDQIRENPLRPAADSFYELIQGAHQTLHARTTWGLTKVIQPHAPELVIAYRSLLAGPDQSDARIERSEAGTSPSLEERLRTLKRLYEQGLVTEDEYRFKRQTLLDEL